MKIVIVAGLADSLLNFRGPLLAAMHKQGHEVYACAPEENPGVKAGLAELGVRYWPVALQRTGMNPLKDCWSCIKLVQVLRQVRPDIILCYTIKPVIYGSLAGWLARVPARFALITGLGWAFMGEGWKQWFVSLMVRPMYGFALHRTDKVFFQNSDDRAFFIRSRLVKDKDLAVLLDGSGIDVAHYHPVPIPGGVVFLLIARLLADKGIGEYVEAARTLKGRHRDVKFQLLGPFDSNPTAISKEQIAQWQASGVIEYLGETKDVRPFLAGASVYVLPSYREGLPRTVLEAMAMGRPVVTTDAPGCRETVVEGQNGFLVPVKDAKALATAMERFILQPELIPVMGKASRRIAEEQYDVRKVNAVILREMGLRDEATV